MAVAAVMTIKIISTGSFGSGRFTASELRVNIVMLMRMIKFLMLGA
jgi:hypothetical protein